MSPEFHPPWLIRSHTVQSILATKNFRDSRLGKWRRRGSRMEAVQQKHLLDAGSGVRLVGMHSRQTGSAARGLVLMIHGWEGSHESVYLYSMACALFAAGYNIFRLNLRDHGGTHDLNEEMFHSARMDEVLGAVRAAQALDPGLKLYVIGFSLGGNFALRVGLQGPAQGINPALTVGISPSINPGATLTAIDSGPFVFKRYFLSKWRKTLAAKKAAWPKYDFSHYDELQSFVETTRQFVREHTPYASYEEYLAQYTLTPSMLMASPSPLAIITAQDDSVIPFTDFAGLEARGSVVSFLAPRHGGHCGFIEDYALECWAEKRVLELLQRH